MYESVIVARTVRRPADTSCVGALQGAPFVAVDLETTGVSADAHRIVEVGAVKMRANGTVVDRFSFVANPGADVPLPRQSQRVHQISPYDIRSAPPLASVLDWLAEFVGEHRVVAHQVAFENRFLTAAYGRLDRPAPRWEGVCTLAASRKFLAARRHSLGYLLQLLGLPAVNDHRACSDAHASGVLLAYLISELGVTDLDPLVEVDGVVPSAPTPRRHFSPASGGPSPGTLSNHGQTLSPVSGGTARRLREAFGGFAPSEEQVAAIDAFQSGENTKLIAVAGSGKTRVLLAAAVLEAERRPDRAGIYLAFNSSVAKQAQRLFPATVTAMTAHSLAYRNLARTRWGPLLGKLGESTTWASTMAAVQPGRVGIDTPAGERVVAARTIARIALQTVEQYCKTTDVAISLHHLPPVAGIDVGSEQHRQLAEAVVPCALRAWAHICDPHSFAVPFGHSHYLKLFADLHPLVAQPNSYILYDEAQDAAPTAASIVLAQRNIQTVVVGDPAQAINRFAGAVNALGLFSAERTATLSRSWRFGDHIAGAANTYLRRLNSTMTVRGNPAVDDVVDSRLDDVDAILTRTNGAAIGALLEAQQAGHSTALVGDVSDALKFCATARALLDGQAPDDQRYAVFASWVELRDYLDVQPSMADARTQAQLIEDHSVDTIETALRNVVAPRRASVTVSTVHKSKGLEFGRVRIAGDFADPDCNDHVGPQHMSPDELDDERRLAYVALTRAKTHLNPGRLLPTTIPTETRAPAGMLF